MNRSRTVLTEVHELASIQIAREVGVDKRLYRSRDDKMIAGVCGGIAEYFGIDPVIVRVILVVITLMGGAGVLAYLIMWAVVPLAPPPSAV